MPTIRFPVAVCLACCLLLGQSGEPEAYRPRFHFTPPRNFMNDPNGLVYYKGEYHLFYQHNPFGNRWGHMSWGHAVSKDLIHWQHLPVALQEENGIMIFSGSAVVDRNNSSGLCGPSGNNEASCLIAIYTGHSGELQTQNLAFSQDQGRTWKKYAGNPVIDLGLKDFRDPKVFWHEPTKRWILVSVLAQERKVRFFASENLKQWTALSDFGPAGSTTGVWECPDLFEMRVDGDPQNTRWMLDVDVNPGAFAGGSGGQYFIGRFDGKQFVNDNPPETTLWVDYGKDFYATTSFSDLPNTDPRRLWMAWFSNWQYANTEPSKPHRGMLTLPRSLALRNTPRGIRLWQGPIDEVKSLRGRHWVIRDKTADQVNTWLAQRMVRGFHFDIEMDLSLETASEGGLAVGVGGNDRTWIGLSRATNEMFVDRTQSGESDFSKDFPGRHSAPRVRSEAMTSMRVLLDRSGVEVFGDWGDLTLTERIFPKESSNGLGIFQKGGELRVIRLEIWEMGGRP